jgi:phage-related protein
VKPIAFLGDSRDALRAFPERGRREAGHQLDRIQHGLDPNDWRPMSSVGAGAREVRVRTAAGSFRIIYVANYADAIYILHAFQKKTRRTPKSDLDLAAARLRELMRRVP